MRHMRVLTEIGEASAQLGDRIFVFRPTLANIADIGTPAEIVEAFVLLHSGPPQMAHPLAQKYATRRHWYNQLCTAMTVLVACCDRPDVHDLIGEATPPYRYRAGPMPADAIVAIARQLLRHGVVGQMPDSAKPSVKRDDDYVREFDAVQMAALAQAHLGVTVEEAWGMTMTSIVRAMAIKYPPADKQPAGGMTVERNDAAVAWLQKVNKLRGAANG